jgi:hypothetical protein
MTPPEFHKRLIIRAREIYADDDLEIEDSAATSETDAATGAWVQAWVFVPYD